jgi:hypothetical protein
MRSCALIVGLVALALASGCAAPGQVSANYSCQPSPGPRSGEFYMFAPTRDPNGYTHCGAGHG